MEETVVQRKVAELIRRELSEILQREYIVMPGILLTISLVRVTGDLSMGKIYVTTFPDNKLAETVFLLNEQTWPIRTVLAARIRNKMRKMPELVFYMDDTLQEVQKMEAVFKKIK